MKQQPLWNGWYIDPRYAPGQNYERHADLLKAIAAGEVKGTFRNYCTQLVAYLREQAPHGLKHWERKMLEAATGAKITRQEQTR